MGTLFKTRFTPVLRAGVLPPTVVAKPTTSNPKIAPRQRGSGLRACPFCRELFTDDETDVCPECGLTVKDLAALPPSADADVLIGEEASRSPHATIPQAEPLPWNDFTRGRGVLVACALAGMVAFFLPWARFTIPEAITYNGMEMAKSAPFFWASFFSWWVLVPAVLSRRSILKMVGARVACFFLSAAPGVQAAFLLARPTHKVLRHIPHEWHWGPGIYLTLAISIVATVASSRFGGRLDDVPVRTGSSKGEVLH